MPLDALKVSASLGLSRLLRNRLLPFRNSSEYLADMYWLPVIMLLPSTILAACKSPNISDVSLDASTHNVTWKADNEPGCLKGFQVCWTSMRDRDVWCDFAPPEASSLQLAGEHMEPCERFNVEVAAISHDHKYTDSRYTHGMAGPPKITDMKLTQQSGDLATLEWSAMSNQSCVSYLELWLCDNSTQDLATCHYKKMGPDTVKFEFRHFQVCRYYYANIRTVAGYNSSPTTTLEMFLDSGNEVAMVEATNVTEDSAVVWWLVSGVEQRCQAEKMKLCLHEEKGWMLPDCWEWMLDQEEQRNHIDLSDLQQCSAYRVVLSLITADRHRHKKTKFITPMAVDALTAKVEHVRNTAAVVRWTYNVANTDCEPAEMQVCYCRRDNKSRLCRTLATARHSSVTISGLTPCSVYTVQLTLLTSVQPRPNYTLNLVTASQGVPVLRSMNVSAAGSNVTVRWTPATDASLQCVRRYNVSWSGVQGRGRGWQEVDADATSFTIPGAVRRATYHVDVAAMLADGTSQTMSGSVVSSDSTRLFSKLSQLLCMLSVLIFLQAHLRL